MAIVVWLIVAEALYVRALRILARRGVAVPRLQVVLWHLGLSLQAIALLSPIGTHADTLLTAHMGEHILLADLGAPLLLAGLRNPVLVFFLPRDVLVPLARAPRLRGAFRWLRHPLVALPRLHGRALHAGTSRSSSRPPCGTTSCTSSST